MIQLIKASDATGFLLPKHYSGRKPQISKAFGWYENGVLQAVCSFGKPASNSLCVGVCGGIFKHSVYELNRLCRTSEMTAPLSKFVSMCLKNLSPYNWIIVSYADTEMNHAGYIYQATNFIYTGATKQRTDKYTAGNKHSRHYDNRTQGNLRKIRSSKHRYIYFATNNKMVKKLYRNNLKYPVEKYPKTENQQYILGDFLEPNVTNIT